jgi:hypothetical protein
LRKGLPRKSHKIGKGVACTYPLNGNISLT